MNARDSLYASRTPDRDINDCADGELRKQAIEAITERIKAGKHRVTLADLLDCELDDPKRCQFLAIEFGKLLSADVTERSLIIERIADGLIERYISVNGDLVEEEACEIEACAGEES